QMQLQAMIKQLGETLREVRLTVYWPDGKKMDHFSVVTHVVSLGPGTDQLQTNQAIPGMPGGPGGNGQMNPIMGPAGPGNPFQAIPGNRGMNPFPGGMPPVLGGPRGPN
ncbi:MAG: hypothetical protein ACK4N5_20095, partial [Myxococcales bacterium]